jgi:hypothetical protein
MQLTGWGCGGTRKIIRLFELLLPAADAQTLGKIWKWQGTLNDKQEKGNSFHGSF